MLTVCLPFLTHMSAVCLHCLTLTSAVLFSVLVQILLFIVLIFCTKSRLLLQCVLRGEILSSDYSAVHICPMSICTLGLEVEEEDEEKEPPANQTSWL